MKQCLAGLFLFAAAVAESQSLSFSSSPAAVGGTYSPDGGLTVVSTMTIYHTGQSCSYFITFSSGNSGAFKTRTAKSGANILNYQIYDNMTNKNVLEDLSAGPSSSNVLSGTFGSGTGTQVQTFTSYFAGGQLPATGTYADSITMNIYVGTVSRHGSSVANRSFSVSVAVPTLLDIAIVPTGSPFNVADTSMTFNFGELATGKTLSADFMVRANCCNAVRVASTNGQILLNGISNDTSLVPYTFTFNGRSVTLSKATAVNVINASASPAGGSRYPMSVTIGTVGWVSAATYQDTLIFVAITN